MERAFLITDHLIDITLFLLKGFVHFKTMITLLTIGTRDAILREFLNKSPYSTKIYILNCNFSLSYKQEISICRI